MKIIIPMAGMGKRMRPHTLTVPKPLIKIAGKTIVNRLCEDISKVSGEQIEEIAFIIGDFGKEVEQELLTIASNLGAKGSIYYQTEALGTAHAIYCAEKSLSGNVIVAFADTLFKADFTLDKDTDSVIWVQRVEDPSAFGVVKMDENKNITDFVEKPKEFVSDLAIIGIYYFKDGDNLRNELKHIIDNNLRENGEFQLTNALENMKNKGLVFKPGEVTEWMDCGNKNATVNTNQRVLEHNKDKNLVAASVKNINSVIIEPCFIGENVVLTNSIVGPHISLGAGSTISNSVISNSIIQDNACISNTILDNSMLGCSTIVKKGKSELNLSDYSGVEYSI
jgi:glucose-1-phosphate thymidylyltransferase